MNPSQSSQIPPARGRSAARAGSVMGSTLLLAAWCLSASPADLPGENLVHLRRAHYVMGTIFEIEVYAREEPPAIRAINEAFDSIREVDHVMSHYRAESDLSRLNREAAAGPVVLPADLYSLLEQSTRFTQITGGSFDISTSALSDLWMESAEKDRVPSDAQITAVLDTVGPGHIIFHPSLSAVSFGREGILVDLGGIAKGWAVDQAARSLRHPAISAALISAGTSTIFALGSPPGMKAWSVGIQHPNEPEQILGVVDLRDASLSTSASYERPLMIQGTAYSHIIDPRTGRPVQHMGSATVVAPTATVSDALSTAVFVLGMTEGERFLRSRGLSGILAAASPETTKHGSAPIRLIDMPTPDFAPVPASREATSHD